MNHMFQKKIRKTGLRALLHALTGSLAMPLVIVTLIAGCGAIEREIDDKSTAEELYRSAKRDLRNGNFLEAVETFETLGARYPFGNYTQQAQLDVAYAYYRQDEFDNAITSAERFIKLYPRNDTIDYAYYIKGLANYSRGSSALERLFPRNMSQVDQSWLRAAFADFDTLVQRFPDSKYAEDSLERMRFLRDEMARHELTIARYYKNRGAMVAAINRVKYMLEHFDGTRHAPAGLALMATAYASLGQKDLQQDTLRVLALNEPRHPALKNLAGD